MMMAGGMWSIFAAIRYYTTLVAAVAAADSVDCVLVAEEIGHCRFS
jgi:hypothetical protein